MSRKFLPAAWHCSLWLFSISIFCNWKYKNQKGLDGVFDLCARQLVHCSTACFYETRSFIVKCLYYCSLQYWSVVMDGLAKLN